jgi:hypothetical protein
VRPVWVTLSTNYPYFKVLKLDFTGDVCKFMEVGYELDFQCWNSERSVHRLPVNSYNNMIYHSLAAKIFDIKKGEGQLWPLLRKFLESL